MIINQKFILPTPHFKHHLPHHLQHAIIHHLNYKSHSSDLHFQLVDKLLITKIDKKDD